jgi:CHAT domain-containing protein
MNWRFGVGKALTRQGWLRLQQVASFCLIGFSLCFCGSLSLMAQNSNAVRIAVAHQHVGSWCLGYLHIDADEVSYEVVKPARYQEHAFRAPRSQITALRQWVLLGQPQNATEMKYGNATYHFWLLADQDLSHVPQVELQAPVTLPYQVLIALIARGGNGLSAANGASGSPANDPSAPNIRGADPDELLKSVSQAMVEYRQHFYQTGNTSELSSQITAARANAQTAYQQFMTRRDSAKAAQGLIAVADIDRMLMVQNRPDYQAGQEGIKQKYNAALELADAGNSAAMRFKALIRLSLTDSNSKDYAAAFEHASKAIDLAMASDNKDDLLNAYENVAQVEIARGDLSAASDYLDRAMNVVGQARDQHVIWLTYTDRADVYANRAGQCNYQHDYAVCKKAFDLAADYTRKALQVAQQAGFDFLARQSQEDLNNRKLLGEQQGKMAATFAELSKSGLGITKASQVIFTPRFAPGANPQLATALRNAERQLFPGPVSPYSVTKWHLDGQLAEMEGNDDAALDAYSRAVTLLDNDRRKLGETQNNSSFLSDQIEVYYAAALQRLDRKQYSEAFRLIERSRARAAADLLASRQLAFRTPELQDLFSQSVELKAQIGKAQNNLFDAAGSQKADSDLIKNLQAKVDGLEGKERALETNIRQRAPKLADLSDRPPVSLEAAQAAARRGNYDILYYLTLESGTVIWHIGADGVHVVKPYYTRHTLTGRVASIRSSLTDPNSTFDEASAAELFLVLVNPVLPYVRTRHLVIVPHEDLTNLPFQVLKDPEDSSFLGERFQISYVPSATVLSGLGSQPDFAHGRLLAMADPAITNAVAEVKAIGSLYPGRGKVVTDTLASKQVLKDSMGSYNLVHLSVHGVFDASNPLLSHVKLRPAQGDDGQLTAAEMFGLNLPENSLVVLSACETGRLNATHGNEVQGIVPALLFAGASTLVLSSWKVDSASTALWMQTFYREAQTKPPSEAARLALLAVKGNTQFQHPFYWAPFLLTGQ